MTVFIVFGFSILVKYRMIHFLIGVTVPLKANRDILQIIHVVLGCSLSLLALLHCDVSVCSPPGQELEDAVATLPTQDVCFTAAQTR